MWPLSPSSQPFHAPSNSIISLGLLHSIASCHCSVVKGFSGPCSYAQQQGSISQSIWWVISYITSVKRLQGIVRLKRIQRSPCANASCQATLWVHSPLCPLTLHNPNDSVLQAQSKSQQNEYLPLPFFFSLPHSQLCLCCCEANRRIPSGNEKMRAQS